MAAAAALGVALPGCGGQGTGARAVVGGSSVTINDGPIDPGDNSAGYCHNGSCGRTHYNTTWGTAQSSSASSTTSTQANQAAQREAAAKKRAAAMHKASLSSWRQLEDGIHQHIHLVGDINTGATLVGGSAQSFAVLCSVATVGVCDAGPAEAAETVGMAGLGVATVTQAMLEVDSCGHYGNAHSCFQSSGVLAADVLGLATPSLAKWGIHCLRAIKEDPVSAAWKKITG